MASTIPKDLPTVPHPMVLWQGVTTRHGILGTIAVRVVRKFGNATKDDWKTSYRSSDVVIEEQTGINAMGDITWSSAQSFRPPPEFWSELFPEP